MSLIDDAETLHRSVRCDSGHSSADGRVVLSASAFNDAGRKPSVDRATLRAAADSKLTASDGIAMLFAREIRGVRLAVTGTDDFYRVDVLHREILQPPNPAHSQIETLPEVPRTRFERLKEALARIATNHGWVIPPA